MNYPADKLRQAPNAVRWYCVPETWIKLFVDKSVVTGSYRFFYDTYLWCDCTEYLILAAAVITVVKQYEIFTMFLFNEFFLFNVDIVHPLMMFFEVGIKKKFIDIHQLLIIPKPWVEKYC